MAGLCLRWFEWQVPGLGAALTFVGALAFVACGSGADPDRDPPRAPTFAATVEPFASNPARAPLPEAERVKIVHTRTDDFYGVQGRTVSEISASERVNGPELQDGTRGIGRMSGEYRYAWQVTNYNGACDIHTLTIFADAKITLPRLDTPDPSPDLAAKFV